MELSETEIRGPENLPPVEGAMLVPHSSPSLLLVKTHREARVFYH